MWLSPRANVLRSGPKHGSAECWWTLRKGSLMRGLWVPGHVPLKGIVGSLCTSPRSCKKMVSLLPLKRQGLPFPNTSNILFMVLLPLPALPQPKFSNKVPGNTCVVITTAVFLRISDDPLLKSRKLLSAWKYPCSHSGIAEIPSRRAYHHWLEFLWTQGPNQSQEWKYVCIQIRGQLQTSEHFKVQIFLFA